MSKMSMNTLSDSCELALQAFLVADQDRYNQISNNTSYKLDGIRLNPKLPANKCTIDPKTFSSHHIYEIRNNQCKILFGVLVTTSVEALKFFLSQNTLIKLSNNAKAFQAIVYCMRNAFAHNPTGGTWNIKSSKGKSNSGYYAKVWEFQHQIGSTMVDISLDLTKADSVELDFDKDLGGFYNAFLLIHLCRQLFDGTVSIANI